MFKRSYCGTYNENRYDLQRPMPFWKWGDCAGLLKDCVECPNCAFSTGVPDGAAPVRSIDIAL